MQVEDNNFTIGVLTQAVPAEERPRFLVNIYPWLNHRARKALKNHWATGECSPNVLRATFEAVEAIRKLWESEPIQSAYSRRNQFQVMH